MCMLIHHPRDAEPFTKSEFRDFHSRNRNGFGAIWRTPSGRVDSVKGLLDLDQTWGLYRGLRLNGCREIVLHWRMATAGAVSHANCHPIIVTKDVLLMHNGVLSHRSTRERSDTVCFVDDVVRPSLRARPHLLHDKSWQDRLAKRIGSSNKLILWHREEAAPIIIGKDRGVTHSGRWYSNTYAWSAPNAVRWAPVVPRTSLVKATPAKRGRELTWPSDRSAVTWPRYEHETVCACGKPTEKCWGCYLGNDFQEG